MSKGRLPGVEGVGNVVQPNGAPIQYVNQSYADDTVTIIPQGSQQVYLNNGNNLIANLQQSIPGIQNIIAIEAQPLFPQGVEPSLTGSDLRAVAEGQTTSNVIVENNYPPYEIIEPPTAVSSAVISSQSEIGESLLQTDVNNDLTNVEMVNVEPGNSQAENQTYMVDNANQIYSQTSAYRVNQKTPHNNSAKEVIVDNSANESYTAISAGPVENVTSENEVLILNSGNDTHAANSETNTFPSPSQSYTSNQSSVLDGNIQAYEATKTVTTNRTVAKSLRKETVSRANENRTIKLVKTAAGDIVEIEIINDELETVKTEPDIETTRDKVLHVGAEKEVQSKARAEQAAESIMQALRQKLEAAKNTPKPPTRHVVPSPVQPGRSLLKSTPHSARTVPSSSQVKLVRGPAQPARSPSQSAQSILPAAQSLAPTVQGPSGTSQSPGPIAANPAGTAPSSSLESTSAVQTPKSPVANVLPSLGPTFNGNQIISQTLLSPESASRMPGLPQPGPNDQYVLVTVMPESGQETIIHVYRLHGGQLAQ